MPAYPSLNILDRIMEGEDSKTEFKSKDFHNDSLAKEIVAFSNMHGGDIFIGVEDAGQIEGIVGKAVEARVINICRNNIAPPIIPDVVFHSIQDKRVLQVAVEAGKYKPYKVKHTNKYYIRAGSVSIEPTNEELIRLFQNGAQLHFEVSKLPGTSIADIDLLKFRTYCTDYRSIEWEDDGRLESLLYNFQIVDETGQLTVLGALFFAKNVFRRLPQAGIDLHHFDGLDATGDYLDFKNEASDIPTMITSAQQFVKINTRIQAHFNAEQTQRRDQPDYEPFAVRELLSNAFMHRDWSIFGQQIRLNLYADRLEVFSPGSLPNTLNLQRALAGISYYRNPVIAQMLKDYKLVEKAGRGLLKIVKWHKDNNRKLPDFDITDTYFKVILYNVNFVRNRGHLS